MFSFRESFDLLNPGIAVIEILQNEEQEPVGKISATETGIKITSMLLSRKVRGDKDIQLAIQINPRIPPSISINFLD